MHHTSTPNSSRTPSSPAGSGSSPRPAAAVLAILAAVLLLLTACSSGITVDAGAGASDPADTGSTLTPRSSTADETPSGSLPMVADPDAPARLSLRATGSAGGETIFLGLRPELGETWEGSMVMHIEVALSGQPDVVIPKFRMNMAVEVTDVQPDGGWTGAATFGEITVTNDGSFSASEIRQLEGLMNEMQAISINTTVDKYGVTQDLEVLGLESLPPELAESMDFSQQMENFTTTVPTQEVGVGATWTDTNSMEINGVQSQVITTFVITDISGDTYTLDMTTELQMDATITEAGETVEMTGTLTGGGTTVIDVTEPGPLSVSSVTGGELDMTVGSEELTMTMTMELDMAGR